MKRLLFSLVLLASTKVFSLELSTSWTDDFKKEVNLHCSADESQICESLCESKNKCSWRENICHDCVGTSTYTTFIFREMGRSLTSDTNFILSWGDVFEFLAEGSFTTITSKSIFNQIERYDSPKLQKKFQSLCPADVKYPVVFFRHEEFSRQLGEVNFVVCGDKIYGMNLDPEIDIDSLYSDLY